MFKIFKYSIVLLLIKFNFASAEIIKPSTNIKPSQVIKIQLKSLMKNDAPYIDQGIEQTWEFAHPNNQKFTGPLSRFKEMIKGESYKMLLNHKDHKINQVFSDENKVIFEVIVMDSEKKYYMFKWQVEKYLKSGPLQNCWLTTMVSAPISLGSSI